MPYKCVNCGVVTGDLNFRCTKTQVCGFKTGRFRRTDESAWDDEDEQGKIAVSSGIFVFFFVVALIVAQFLEEPTSAIVFWGLVFVGGYLAYKADTIL